jgi:multiple sugar transport system ATP-binding protein
MRAEIARIQQNVGVTTLYVTHDQVEAMTMGHRVAVMSKGYLQQVDTPQNLYDSPDNLFVATFIGSPQMNLMVGRLTVGDVSSINVGPASISIPGSVLAARPALQSYSGRDVIVGIRPENLEDAAIATGAVDGQFLEMDVTMREGLGSEVVLHGAIDGTPPQIATAQGEALAVGKGVPIIARCDPRTTLQRGGRARFAINTERLQFFDAETGLAIRS